MTETPKKLSGAETIKRESNHLRGNIAADMAAPGLEVSNETYELLKFHGSYFGYNRDSATERKQQGLDKEHEFMLRLKMPGGRLTAKQYLGLDAICDQFANGTLRITTRETFQFHCIVKPNMKPFIQQINHLLMSTLGGCGDVVRNVITCPAPIKDNIHAILQDRTYLLAKHCAPKTDAYWEVWMDGEKVENYPFNPTPNATDEAEPLYGDTYMPRKFKIAIGQPEDNCMDAMANDLAILALFNGQELQGYNFALGGGLGMNHNQPKTYPYLAKPIMYVPNDLFIPATEAVIKLQRDFGDRTNRKHARLKYVVNEMGAEWVKAELEKYLGRSMDAPMPMPKFAIENHLGWQEQGDGKWFLGLPISSGRIIDREGEQIRTGLREIIKTYGMDVRLTADQNILLCDIDAGEKEAINGLLKKYGIKRLEDISMVYRDFLACVALPTCGKALAEAERVKLPLVEEIEQLMARHGLQDEKIAIRLAGCPNGCSRPYIGDIGIVGRMPGHYALFIGGDFEGTRLNEKIFDRVPFEHITNTLEPMIEHYKTGREDGEGFGDFCQRVGVESVKQTAVSALSSAHDWAK